MAEPLPDWAEQSGIRRIQPSPGAPPAGQPGGFPRTYTVRIPLFVPVVVFFTVFLWEESETAPAWLSELNPITRQPYTSVEECEQVRRLSPAEIQAAQQAHIKATQSQAPPAPAPPPAPTPTPSPQAQPQPAPQKQPDPKCDTIAAEIKKIIEAKRDPTPPGGFPKGRKGIMWRWREIAANEGNGDISRMVDRGINCRAT